MCRSWKTSSPPITARSTRRRRCASRAILFAALGYFILPADTIPDVIFGLGFTDDIAVLTAALAAVRAHLKPAHLAAAKEALSQD